MHQSGVAMTTDHSCSGELVRLTRYSTDICCHIVVRREYIIYAFAFSRDTPTYMLIDTKNVVYSEIAKYVHSSL